MPPDGKVDGASMERLAKLEGAFDSYQKTLVVFGALVAFLGAVMLGGFSLLSLQVTRVDGRIDRLDGRIDRLDTKIDSVPKLLAEEFRAMRTEMAAQTSAIANSVTSARATPTQVVLVPAPGPTIPPKH